MITEAPKTQYAVQLVGPEKLVLNKEKQVYTPGPYQLMAEVVSVGLCYSDVKLLKQFDKHVRKGEIIKGVDKHVLEEDKSYKPGTEPTVPGHEVCCRIISVGEKVKHHQVGEHILVQADFRWLRTEHSNGAFGYNIEGALQQYITVDERMFVNPENDVSFLLDVDKNLSASAVALVEPWTCVESSYISPERKTIAAGETLLVAAESGREIKGIAESFCPKGKPAKIIAYCRDSSQVEVLEGLGVDVEQVGSLDEVENESMMDIIYFGSEKVVIEVLNDKLAKCGLINIVLGGEKIGVEVAVDVGNVHYGLTRWIGSVGDSASESYEYIPATGEIRDNENVLVIGAAGPMGQMHVIRLVCAGFKNVQMTGTDFDDERLASLHKKASGAASANGVELKLVNPKNDKLDEKFSYISIMAPVAGLVAESVKDSAANAIINIFAGIPAGTKQAIDLDVYIQNKCYMFGTSGSTLEDMKTVLDKVKSGQLDTNLSCDAICGMAGAIDGIQAVQDRKMAGKIIVYPKLKELGLVNLEHLHEVLPSVADKLNNGLWSKEAEEELLKTAK